MQGLFYIIAAVRDDLTERFTAAGATVPTFHVGPRWLVTEEAPPRVVFVPTTDALNPSQRIGSPDVDGQPRARSLLTRFPMCRVHVWGDPAIIGGDWTDEERGYIATDELVNQVLHSLHLKGVGQRVLGSGVWTSSEPQSSLDVKYGEEYTFTFEVKDPVVATQPTMSPSDTILDFADRFGDSAETGCSTIGGP
jgi:hypothetical protein